MTPKSQRIQVLIMAFRVDRLGLKFSSYLCQREYDSYYSSVPEYALSTTTEF